MASTTESHEPTLVTELDSRLHGRALGPDDAGYDEARSLWNGMIDSRPTVIARCTGAADVMAAVRCAADNGLPVGVRGAATASPERPSPTGG